MTLTIVPRALWHARPPKNKPVLVSAARREGFRVHYSGANKLQTVRSIQDYCMDNRGFNDIDYNHLVDFRGIAYEGRGWNVVGSHTKGFNTVDYGVCAIGVNADITEAQMTTIRALYDEACTRSDKALVKRYHGQNANTDCPGTHLIRWVKAGMPYPPGTQPAPRHPAYPQRVMKRGSAVDLSVRVWQGQMKRRGWDLKVDGVLGPETQNVILLFQREKGLKVTGTINGQTWDAAWTAPVT